LPTVLADAATAFFGAAAFSLLPPFFEVAVEVEEEPVLVLRLLLLVTVIT
jgi:hypothetical protein